MAFFSLSASFDLADRFLPAWLVSMTPDTTSSWVFSQLPSCSFSIPLPMSPPSVNVSFCRALPKPLLLSCYTLPVFSCNRGLVHCSRSHCYLHTDAPPCRSLAQNAPHSFTASHWSTSDSHSNALRYSNLTCLFGCEHFISLHKSAPPRCPND